MYKRDKKKVCQFYHYFKYKACAWVVALDAQVWIPPIISSLMLWLDCPICVLLAPSPSPLPSLNPHIYAIYNKQKMTLAHQAFIIFFIKTWLTL